MSCASITIQLLPWAVDSRLFQTCYCSVGTSLPFLYSNPDLNQLIPVLATDLSFNCIDRISGLSSLRKLQDLSLFNNDIVNIEGLVALESLQCLSLGNNKLAVLDEILELRQLPQLYVLSLSGNPMCNNRTSYRSFTLAFLPHLKYLDYDLVTQAQANSMTWSFLSLHYSSTTVVYV